MRVRRTHPGATRAATVRARRPQTVAVPCTARAPTPDVRDIAQLVLDMRDAHALDERIDRFLARVVTALQAKGGSPAS